METQIKKWGNSLGLRIPKNIANASNISDGSVVELRVKNNKIEIVAKAKFDLEEMLASISEDNLHKEISTGESLGNEI